MFVRGRSQANDDRPSLIALSCLIEYSKAELDTLL